MRVGSQLKPLPVGSHLEEQHGVFMWTPGVGFVGRYDLVFGRTRGEYTVARYDVRIVLEPKP